MKRYLSLITLSTFCLFLSIGLLSAQNSPVGLWKTIDDETGEASSHIEIVEKDGRYFGKIVKLLQEDENTICEKCPGEKKNQLLVGMEVLWDLKKHKDYWSYGRIMDPKNGKTYKCNIRLEGEDKLKVRGYIGFAALGRNQIWHRL